METLNPDIWGEITNTGTTGDNIFNALMGVDPVTNETTAYVDQNAFAYMAWYLQSKGIFETKEEVSVKDSDIEENFPTLKSSLKSDIRASFTSHGYGLVEKKYPTSSDAVVMATENSKQVNMFSLTMDEPFMDISPQICCCSKDYFRFGLGYQNLPPNYNLNFNLSPTEYTKNNLTVYNNGGTVNSPIIGGSVPIIKVDKNISVRNYYGIMWLLAFKGVLQAIGMDGVGTQDGSIVPDLSGANSLDDVLNILKNTLPNVFNNAITNSIPQPDGSIKNYTYVPIPLPNTNNNNDPQPETGNQTQAKPQVNPETSPDTLLDLIIKLIGNKLDTPNPPDTGTGNTPPVVLPTGSANALYKIYNPTQAEINSFGAWLWSSNFVDQLLKVFNNPMESIIGLHKVYASPIIGGRSNIKVGYLDSGVNSNFVANQYTKIDCGTVNLQEYFGNVFDYSPYTNIELYLPCIGFVQLDVGNVMRSSINITYTVDVLTGACIAEINIKRDGYGGVLYSYSGNCASQYPLSSGSYMGIVSSVIGVAGSIVGTVASGGSLAPLALGATSGLLNAKTHVQHSGSLSGNSGVMGGKIPYLIITRPQTNMAENYQHLQGIPSNTYTQLSACRGFVKVKNVNVQNIIAESEELEEIKTLLLDGVII